MVQPVSPVELLIKRCNVAAGCAWEVGNGGNKTEPQEPEVRNILRDCAHMLEGLGKAVQAYAETIDNVRQALRQKDTHYLVVADDVKDVVDALRRISDPEESPGEVRDIQLFAQGVLGKLSGDGENVWCEACSIESEIGSEENPHPVPRRFHVCGSARKAGA